MEDWKTLADKTRNRMQCFVVTCIAEGFQKINLHYYFDCQKVKTVFALMVSKNMKQVVSLVSSCYNHHKVKSA